MIPESLRDKSECYEPPQLLRPIWWMVPSADATTSLIATCQEHDESSTTTATTTVAVNGLRLPLRTPSVFASPRRAR